MKAHKLRRKVRDGGLLHRILTIRVQRRRWWDWGHMVMTLFGDYRGYEYTVPRGRDLWYRFPDGNETRGRIITTFEYADVRQNPDGEWRILDVQDDGHTVMFGNWGGRTTFYGWSRRELALFRRWDFWECRVRGEWLGLRRWIYFKGLHAAVHQRIPFTCQQVPPRGTGGYDHWHCQERGKHTIHRFNNYRWREDGTRVEHEPVAR